MSKKSLKILLCLTSIAAFITAVIYVLTHKKKKATPTEDAASAIPQEETLDAGDALDLSSLKFSRHYVDLR